ncbi:hypothetical protein QQP08_025029 [Theobroma cacao]|nr:hypothetical protein QQP08_025029 [Theobroma cacao]
MSKVAQMESLSHNAVVLDSFLGFALQAMVVETAIVASKSVAWLLMMMGTRPNGIDVFIKETEAYAGFPLAQLLVVRKPGLENKDASDTEDDDDDDDEEDEAADDQDEDGGEEEDGSGEEGLDNRPSRRQQKRRIPSIGETDCAEASQRIAFDEEAIAFDEEAIVTLLLKDIWIHDFSQICQTLKKTALTVVMTGDERIVDDWQLPIGLLGSILFLDLFRGDFGFPILAESPSPVTY